MLNIRSHGVVTQIHARWEGIKPRAEQISGGSDSSTNPFTCLLDLDDITEIESDLVEPFHVLLQMLVCDDGRSIIYHRLGHPELLDRVLVLARILGMEELAESIASELMKQEEERIAKCQCLNCGGDHPVFSLVSRELCDRCCNVEGTLLTRRSVQPTQLRAALDEFLESHREEIAVHAVTSDIDYGHGLGEAFSI